MFKNRVWKTVVVAILAAFPLSLPAQEAGGEKEKGDEKKKSKVIPAARLAPMAPGKPVDPATLKKRFEKKLEKPFVKKTAWILDYDRAMAVAGQQKKLIFAYFTRSYAR